LSRNFGKEAALAAGLDSIGHADAVIMMDCDLQHPPEMIDTMLELWLEQGYDVAYTVKTSRKGEGAGKSLLSGIFYWTVNRGNRFRIPRDAEDFRLLSARAVKAMCNLPERERLMKGLYSWIGFRQIAIPFDKPPRAGGQTSFPPLRLFVLAIDGITAFTVAPLRLMLMGGIAVSLVSFLYGLVILAQKLLFDVPVPGLASTLVMISFFGGMQLLCIGVIGEYVGRTLVEAKGRPLFLVESDIRLPAAPEFDGQVVVRAEAGRKGVPLPFK
jgi:glycosyltransferase involved in cell wall biosynthesis